jgi:hypothetical protein
LSSSLNLPGNAKQNWLMENVIDFDGDRICKWAF